MDRFYYISQGESPATHLSNIADVCKAGCKLIQLRMKEYSVNDVMKTAFEAKAICVSHGATLIVNDHIGIARTVDADGVHLGKNDRSPVEARALLGGAKIIGGTANTFEDCIRLIDQHVGYIGLGPYRFTMTKKNPSPILGLKGYHKILESLMVGNHETPVYAIGGILAKDLTALFNTGIAGVAVSGLFTGKSQATLKKILRTFDERTKRPSL